MTAAQRAEAEMAVSAQEKSGPRRMLNEKQVLLVVPVGRTALYRMEKEGRFPKSTYISPNRRVWFADEIIAWQNSVDEFNPNRGRGKGRRRKVSLGPSYGAFGRAPVVEGEADTPSRGSQPLTPEEPSSFKDCALTLSRTAEMRENASTI